MEHKFFTEESAPLQYGVLYFKKGQKVRPHYHQFGTCEWFSVVVGMAKFITHGDNGEVLNVKLLKTNDWIMVYKGGHSLEFIEDTVMHEVKTGPYKAEDKVFYTEIKDV